MWTRRFRSRPWTGTSRPCPWASGAPSARPTTTSATARPRCSPPSTLRRAKVTEACFDRYRHQEFRRFLTQIAKALSAGAAAPGGRQLRHPQASPGEGLARAQPAGTAALHPDVGIVAEHGRDLRSTSARSSRDNRKVDDHVAADRAGASLPSRGTDGIVDVRTTALRGEQQRRPRRPRLLPGLREEEICFASPVVVAASRPGPPSLESTDPDDHCGASGTGAVLEVSERYTRHDRQRARVSEVPLAR